MNEILLMSNEFKDSRLRWSRAKEHLVDLKRGIQSFFDTKPCTSLIEPDPDGIHEVYKIRFTKTLPDELVVMTAEVIEHLRAALDLACYVSAKILSGANNPRNAHFPVAPDLANFKGKFKGKSKDIPEEIRPLFYSLKPYKGGNDLLWALNRIAGTNKHTMLVPVAFVRNRISVAGTFIGGEFPTFYGPNWDRCNEEIILFKSKLCSKGNYYGDVSVVIAFDEVEIVGGKPVETVLNDLVGEVDSILSAIEAETRRLKDLR